MLSGTAPIWPRISPAGLRGVWMFTYARPASSAASTEPRSVTVLRTPLRHGPHSGTATGPDLPRAPVWMWAAVARPVSLLKVSRHVIEAVVPDFAIVAVNPPRARLTRPFGRGTSWRAVRVARALAVIPT